MKSRALILLPAFIFLANANAQETWLRVRNLTGQDLSEIHLLMNGSFGALKNGETSSYKAVTGVDGQSPVTAKSGTSSLISFRSGARAVEPLPPGCFTYNLTLESFLHIECVRDNLDKAPPGADASQSKAQEIAITEDIKKPGIYDISSKENPTLGDAIAWAGGPLEYGDLKKIRLVRFENGVKRILILNASPSRDNKSKDRDFLLKPGDEIIVPQLVL